VQDGSGKIDAAELLTVMKSLGQAPDASEVADMINDVDVNGDGEIDFNEFLEMMARRLGTDNNQGEELRQAFKVFDKDGDGFITAVELKLVMKQLGEDLSDEQLADMMREADNNGDGRIDFGEFCKMMGGK
jgi:calmodulin